VSVAPGPVVPPGPCTTDGVCITAVSAPSTAVTGGSVQVTVTYNTDLGPTPYRGYLVDTSSNTPVGGSCGTGTSCTITFSEYSPGTYTLAAVLSTSDPSPWAFDVHSAASTLTVSGSSVATPTPTATPSGAACTADGVCITEVSAPSTAQVGSTVVVTVSYNLDLGRSYYWGYLVDTSSDTPLGDVCWSGTTCTFSFSAPGRSACPGRAAVKGREADSAPATSSTGNTFSQFGQSRFSMRSAIGAPIVFPWRIPAKASTRSFSIFCRPPRP